MTEAILSQPLMRPIARPVSGLLARRKAVKLCKGDAAKQTEDLQRLIAMSQQQFVPPPAQPLSGNDDQVDQEDSATKTSKGSREVSAAAKTYERRFSKLPMTTDELIQFFQKVEIPEYVSPRVVYGRVSVLC